MIAIKLGLRGDNGDAGFPISIIVFKFQQVYGWPNLMEGIYNESHDNNMSLRRPVHEDHFFTVQEIINL